jgi:hypothetical protein
MIICIVGWFRLQIRVLTAASGTNHLYFSDDLIRLVLLADSVSATSYPIRIAAIWTDKAFAIFVNRYISALRADNACFTHFNISLTFSAPKHSIVSRTLKSDSKGSNICGYCGGLKSEWKTWVLRFWYASPFLLTSDE